MLLLLSLGKSEKKKVGYIQSSHRYRTRLLLRSAFSLLFRSAAVSG